MGMREGEMIRVTVLGTGTSTGIPVIGCTCPVCTSEDSRDQRLRCSCFVSTPSVDLLIDAGPDFRQQAIRAGLSNIDAVLITHHHFDHIVGLDDLRPFLFENREAIPCYSSPLSADVLNQMFAYIFQDGSYPGTPRLTLNAVADRFEVASRGNELNTEWVTPIPVEHGDLAIYGYRIGTFAYLTDTSGIPESSMALLEGLDVLILDALRHTPHPKHMTISDSVSTAERIGAKQTYFIHMAHSVQHAVEEAKLPDGMALAFDGLTFDVQA